MQIRHTLFRHLSNIPGWRTNRRIIVFESDDWGSIRMPSNTTRDILHGKGIDLFSGDSFRYNTYDTLATAADLTALFETLYLVKDKNDHPPVFTAISLAANPDFEKIKACGYNKYYFEPFTETLKRYPGCQNSFKLWKEGAKNKLFIPQFHGREHLNVQVWMKALQNNDPFTRLAFDHGMWGFKNSHPSQVKFQAAFDLDVPEELIYQKEVIATGLNLFEKLHNYQATFFVPPNGCFNEKLEETAFNGGIRFLSSPKIFHEPLGNRLFKKRYHWLGQQNKYGQRYITRNAFFEPSQPGKDWVDSCLNDISIAFQWNKPAIISTHRVNYIGALQVSNRDRGLLQLRNLLTRIIKKWPDVEFMTSNQLGNLLLNI